MSLSLPDHSTANSKQNPLKLSGTVERVVFHNPENGFVVARIRGVMGHAIVTVVGQVGALAPGEMVHCVGLWVENKQHGKQFKASEIQTTPPVSKEGLMHYLASGAVKGVGAHFAKILVDAFGIDLFDVMDHHPEKLLTLPGIGKQRLQQLIEAWQSQKALRHILLFLQNHGLGIARATRIYKIYGEHAIAKVQENPYALCEDIHGIGFKIADGIAQSLGIAADATVRIQAGLQYVLQQEVQQGSCAMARSVCVENTAELLSIDSERVDAVLTTEIHNRRFEEEDKSGTVSCIFLKDIYEAEVNVARQLKRLLSYPARWLPIDTHKAIPWVETQTQMQLSLSQKCAVEMALKNKLSIITGGPGVGKTTVTRSILRIASRKNISIALCAPTGRAAKRLSETTGFHAKTIHRLLGRQSNGFQYHRDNPLKIDLLIVDESSMLDILLLQHLLNAIPDRCVVIFVGDCDQLPSVGAGNVLSDLIASQKIAMTHLTEIFRQAKQSQIILNAHRVNSGKMPLVDVEENGDLKDFYFIHSNDVEDIQKKLLSVVTERIPKRFQLDPVRDVQVLTPMNRNPLGAQQLNPLLQNCFHRPDFPKIEYFGRAFFLHDKVMQTVNNYDKEVFNGDIGRITQLDAAQKKIWVTFDEHEVLYDESEWEELSLAYAITVHKSQGSEYPAVVIPIATQHYLLLERNLIYTAITRARKLVVIVGQKKALAMAVRSIKNQKRLTFLTDRLRDS